MVTNVLPRLKLWFTVYIMRIHANCRRWCYG